MSLLLLLLLLLLLAVAVSYKWGVWRRVHSDSARIEPIFTGDSFATFAPFDACLFNFMPSKEAEPQVSLNPCRMSNSKWMACPLPKFYTEVDAIGLSWFCAFDA